ncbi:hypothetical protein LOTGIDRAFT_231759 [Lottia gigantea]|uniref:F-box domain-containing protein n=1 Tax=Lottia gigantea TaxID=225164 RepID=V4AIZ2_LOTGI|nr:hypothetical protein LOTGIDRAFT_231759 [Lottia gigantea]ESO97012.1 hypothetical protein LOTGIDRAFT_231759 [Lottia gigantea]
MPRKKSSDSLADICLKNIAKNMDSYWLSDLDSDFGENPYLMYIVGPFEHLTEWQIQKLIYTLSSLKLLKRRHLQILISGILKSLDLSKSIIAANNGLILKSVAFRCQRLTSLNIRGCNYITPNVIAESIRNLPLLKHLQLSRTKTNDMVLSVIGDYCSFLLSLDISGCVVSNKGADNLCQTYSKDGPKCLSLQKLNIQATHITIKGAVAIIQTFRDLRLFDFIDSFEAMISVVKDNISVDDMIQT